MDDKVNKSNNEVFETFKNLAEAFEIEFEEIGLVVENNYIPDPLAILTALVKDL